MRSFSRSACHRRAFWLRCGPSANSESRPPGSVFSTSINASSKGRPLRSARAFAWRSSTSRAISETVCSGCMLFSSFSGCSRSLRVLPSQLLRRSPLALATSWPFYVPLPSDLFQLVVPEQLHAPLIQLHVEGQVLGVAPLFADRTRKAPPLGATPGLAHPYPRADPRFF